MTCVMWGFNQRHVLMVELTRCVNTKTVIRGSLISVDPHSFRIIFNKSVPTGAGDFCLLQSVQVGCVARSAFCSLGNGAVFFPPRAKSVGA
jgi:hypothetical protein